MWLKTTGLKRQRWTELVRLRELVTDGLISEYVIKKIQLVQLQCSGTDTVVYYHNNMNIKHVYYGVSHWKPGFVSCVQAAARLRLLKHTKQFWFSIEKNGCMLGPLVMSDVIRVI